MKKRILYPFSAIVGQETMKTALLLNAVDPTIGGALIQGQKGTGKSTAVRALAQLLPEIEIVEGCSFHCSPDDPDLMHENCLRRFNQGEQLSRRKRSMPMVEFPLSATEDRVVGSLHVEHALQTGERHFEPGLLASANRGILYVDEVNLLDDHLVDILLDTAASGINVVEREGISFSHPAKFILLGTMNPEEGDLRPQFLDRFGLCVTIKGLSDESQRREIVIRRIAFERNPDSFQEQWAESEVFLSRQIDNARERLSSIQLPDREIDRAVRIALNLDAQGHRADIAILKTARALAAFMEKSAVTKEEIWEAARFVMPHRMNSSPLDTPESLQERLSRALTSSNDEEPLNEQEISSDLHEMEWDMEEAMQVPGSAAAGSIVFSFLKKKTDEKLFDPDELIPPSDLEWNAKRIGAFQPGRRKRTHTSSRAGRYRFSRPIQKGEKHFDVAIDATLRAAVMRKTRISGSFLQSPLILASDLRKKIRQQQRNSLIVFVVDASDSMSSHSRMAVAKGAALVLLSKAYRNRDRIAMVGFEGDNAEIILHPTASVIMAQDRLRRLPTGGATPFADGLLKAWRLIQSERWKNPYIDPQMVILSDGEANVPLKPGYAVFKELYSLARKISLDRIRSIVIDTQAEYTQNKEMRKLADSLQASYHHIKQWRISNVLNAIQSMDIRGRSDHLSKH